jgi:predicted 2-oxoglutarate/Fe(II)-dependent dioxygenase YbiX
VKDSRNQHTIKQHARRTHNLQYSLNNTTQHNTINLVRKRLNNTTLFVSLMLPVPDFCYIWYV